MVKSKHVDWFYLGARTLRAHARMRGVEDRFPSDEDWYVCPLCLTGLTIEEFKTGELSIEHVPPEALGGKDLVLTCKQCNNSAGSEFDSHASKQEELRRIILGESNKPHRAKFEIDGITTNVDVHMAGRSPFIVEPPMINNPASARRREEYMRALSATHSTDFRFTLTPTRLKHCPDRARVSWIRTAYLAAFALFGWSYALHESLGAIREQLGNPSTIRLPLLSTYNPDENPERYELWVIREPVELQSLLVIAGRNSVFLPSRSDTSLEQLSEQLGAHTNERFHFKGRGDIFPWPSGPQHLLDPPPLTR